MAAQMLSAPEIQDDISIFEQTSPESLRARALFPQPHDLSTNEDWTSSAETEDDYFPRAKAVKGRQSNRSSISSFPASVLHHGELTDVDDNFHTPTRAQTPSRASKSPAQGYLSAFRHPSSVRALQLESEYADSDVLSTQSVSRSRRNLYGGSRSPGSVHSSPTKRSSRPATPGQQSSSKLKKEFPLVLLHCTLLLPAVATRGSSVSNEILQAVLPETYRKRWKILQDKVATNSEVRQRGVLISHPREDYDLLEESLLETLELERPRIRQGHFLGSKPKSDSDSGFESSSQNGTDEASDAEDEVQTRQCSGCGGNVSCNVEQERKWEVKVFAANGLMRSGAWSAAWEEMEKVDVEISIWMPEDIRTEVEERLLAIQAKEEAETPVAEEPVVLRQRGRKARSSTAKSKHDARMREIYGEVPIDKHKESASSQVTGGQTESASKQEDTTQDGHLSTEARSGLVTASQSDASNAYAAENFVSFMLRHGRMLWHDQRNLAIVLLSIMVLFFSAQHTTFTASPTHSSMMVSLPVAASVTTLTSMSIPSPSIEPSGPEIIASTNHVQTSSAGIDMSSVAKGETDASDHKHQVQEVSSPLEAIAGLAEMIEPSRLETDTAPTESDSIGLSVPETSENNETISSHDDHDRGHSAADDAADEQTQSTKKPEDDNLIITETAGAEISTRNEDVMEKIQLPSNSIFEAELIESDITKIEQEI